MKVSVLMLTHNYERTILPPGFAAGPLNLPAQPSLPSGSLLADRDRLLDCVPWRSWMASQAKGAMVALSARYWRSRGCTEVLGRRPDPPPAHAQGWVFEFPARAPPAAIKGELEDAQITRIVLPLTEEALTAFLPGVTSDARNLIETSRRLPRYE